MAAPGTRLGPYTVLAQLGEGGMGEVHLALDTRLNREVALKMLPASLARDAERLARFRQEALLLAALNHPNVATIHGFEEPEPGTLLLVMERVEGQTLSERLQGGALAYEDALQVCAQVAEALEAAHERGVVHRDLKPGNVMIGPRGLVKVLDFGLARGPRAKEGEARPAGAGVPGAAAPDATPQARPPAASPPPVADATLQVKWADRTLLPGDSTLLGAVPVGGEDATMASSGSGEGVVQGTPGYMSPEQILAGEQDARTDVFAFGALLYECLAGGKAFAGESPLDMLRATLEREPDWTRLPARTSPAVRELLARCLRKDPGERLAEMRPARLELEEALGIRRASALRAGEAAATPHNLPQKLTSFVGREAELATGARMLGQTRLLTLTGMGGSGKTRLALQLAENLLPEFPDGVWFVDLAAVNEAPQVEIALATAVGAREEPGRPLAQTLAERLANRRTLIVLDNCEHLLRACCGLVTFLLTAAEDLKVLATSREALGLAGEAVRTVPSLALPGERERGGAKRLAAFESVRLFTERAVLADPRFELTETAAPAVAEICRRLDGIPLAIELAAARVRVLGVEQIRAKLNDRFRLLTGGSREGLPRQQTLRATIQWSYDHLLAEEQELLRRLSVFAGGWTLEGAAAVTGESADEFEVLDLLTRLVDKSLVAVERGETHTRYRFLESVRHYALELLGQSEEQEALRDRHLAFYFELAARAEQQLTGPEQGRWFAELDQERENLLAALGRCVQLEDGGERGLRLATSLARFWSARGYYELGRRALEGALVRSDGAAPSAVRALALVRAGGLALYQGDFAQARPLIEESLAAYRALGDRKGIARALNGVATTAMYQGDFEASRAHYEEGLALYREMGNRRGEAQALHNLGYLTLAQGETESARVLYEQALTALRAVGDRATIALTLADLGMISTRLGQPDRARAQLVEALRIAGELGALREAAYGLEGASELAEATGEPGPAARMLGAARALRESIGNPLAPSEQRQRDAVADRIRAALGEGPMESALAAGRAQESSEAVAGALAWLETPAPRRV